MKRRSRALAETDYWQSNADLMTGLVLVLLLVISLLILYLLQIPEHSNNPSATAGDTFELMTDAEPGDSFNGTGYIDDQQGMGGTSEIEGQGNPGGYVGAGGSMGMSEVPDDLHHYDYPLPSSTGGDGDDWGKAAVYVNVVDEESGRAIREAGLTFELYEEQRQGAGGAIRFLNTYYPEHIEYKEYETTAQGVFYLPEKIEQGNYYFKMINEPEGYDAASDVHFVVDDVYDWLDPFVVSIQVGPSKNVIPVEMRDSQSQEKLTEGVFAITAAEDILTSDNTLRLTAGALADSVVLDEDGNGRSQELFLGLYSVAPSLVPQYYAVNTEPTIVAVGKKTDGVTPETVTFYVDKTKIQVRLTDELYDSTTIGGAEFSLSVEGRPELQQTGTTDSNGVLTFTNLEKNCSYKLRQISAPGSYQYENNTVDIYVNEQGLIDNQPTAEVALTNYIVRVSVNLNDQLFNRPVTNANMALYNSAGELIRSWTATGSAQIFENLPAGGYYVLVNNSRGSRHDFTVTADRSLQTVTITQLTMQDIGTVAGALLGGIVGLFLLIRLLMWIFRKREPKEPKPKKSRRKKGGDEA